MSASAIAEMVVDHMLDPDFCTSPTLRVAAQELSEQRKDMVAAERFGHITQDEIGAIGKFYRKRQAEQKAAQEAEEARHDIFHCFTSMLWAAGLWSTVFILGERFPW